MGRTLDWNITSRKGFDRQTVDGNEGFVLEIPFLEGAFGTKHFIVDKANGQMAGIYDDTIEVIECQAQMEPFNLDQFNVIVATLKQRRQGFDISSVADPCEVVQQGDQQVFPSIPKEFQTFNRLKDMKYDGNMLTSERRSALYWDQAKVIIDMVDSYDIFARCMFFNPEMSDTYKINIDKYTGYTTSVVRNIDIYLQEDQLMHTKCGFPLVPIPTIPTHK